MGDNQEVISSSALTETFDRLLASKTFSRSGQLKRLLVYLREATASTDPSIWSETAIGTNAFGRKDFNPKLDTIVRVEMRRLRQKLDEYYAQEGADSPLRLRFERNTYRPYVEPYVPAPSPALVELVPASIPVPIPIPPDRFWKGVAWGAASVALVMLKPCRARLEDGWRIRRTHSSRTRGESYLDRLSLPQRRACHRHSALLPFRGRLRAELQGEPRGRSEDGRPAALAPAGISYLEPMGRF